MQHQPSTTTQLTTNQSFHKMVSMPAHPRFRSSGSSRATSRASSASLSDDEDAITPAGPAVVTAAPVAPATEARASRRLKGRHLPRRRPVSAASSNADVPSLDLELDDESCSSGSSYLEVTPSTGGSLAAGMDTMSLWQRMLAVQRVFGCYNSARISAALDDEALQSRVPSRVCLDLLNDGILHLPEEEREQVQYFIEHGELKPRKRRSLWRRSFA